MMKNIIILQKRKGKMATPNDWKLYIFFKIKNAEKTKPLLVTISHCLSFPFRL